MTKIAHNQISDYLLPSMPTYTELLSLDTSNLEDGVIVYVRDKDALFAWDKPSNSWIRPKVDVSQVINGWLKSVNLFTDLDALNPADGDVILVRDENCLYRWDNSQGIWLAPAAYPKGFTNGCRMVYDTATTIKIGSGTIAIKSKVVQRAAPVTITWSNVEQGVTKQANTWYFVYLMVDPNNKKQFIGFISITAPTKDEYGNTISSDAVQAKYHPTLDARFVGSFKTDSSQNIVKFRLNGNYVAYIGQGYNYVLSGGTQTTKTAVNCRTFVPLTSSLCQVYYELGSGTQVRYIGDETSWYLKAIAGSGTILMPVTQNSIYYQCSGGNTLSLGIHGYYEDV